MTIENRLLREAQSLADTIDNEFVTGRISNRAGRNAASMIRQLCAALIQPAQPAEGGEAVAYVSPEQLAAFTDPDDSKSGRYLPARKTQAGKFTQAIYTAPPAIQEQAGTHVLLDALRKLSCLGNGDQPGNSDGNLIARRALDAWEEWADTRGLVQNMDRVNAERAT